MWVALKQEELRRDLVKFKLDGSSSRGLKLKEEKENATLASKGQQEQWRRKKHVSKTKCFKCGEFSYYATQCPLRKKDEDEKHDLNATLEEEEFAMTTQVPPGGRWDDLELYFERTGHG